MDRANISYSLKNIPLSTKKAYINALVPKVTSFIQRLRWRAYIFLENSKKKRNTNTDDDSENEVGSKETFGFGTSRSAPPVQALSGFENDLYALISNLKFRKGKSKFQNQLHKDVEMIQKSTNAFVLADKTNNVYTVSADRYKQLLNNNVSAQYMKDNDDNESKINKEAKKICERLDISDRVQRIPPKQAFITIKDHKENFRTNTKCRLINPMKSEIGKISKQKLQSITRSLKSRLKVNQWINTGDVLDWFENLENKRFLSFITFDVVEFYPSITEKLFNDALDFASTHLPIPSSDREIFMNARSSLLFSQGDNWVKQSGLFDTTMGAFDGAECCELIGIFMLHEIKQLFPELNIGLYRDDGLGVCRRRGGSDLDRIRKGLVKLFKDHGLSITIDTGLKQVDFLDVTLDLQQSSYKPFMKQNNTPTYINVESNHPPTIIRQIPDIISKRLNSLSCCKEDFDAAKPEYEEALLRSGYKGSAKLEYTPRVTDAANSRSKKGKKQRKRKVTWFNPPFAANLSTNLGRKFLNLIEKHFPKESPLSKILNRHTVKLSYSCMPNMRATILQHNNKLLRSNAPPAPSGCNCKKYACPLQGNCLAENIVYEANIQHDNRTVKYYGSTSTSFKTRWRNHAASFRASNSNKANDTALAAFVWDNNLQETEGGPPPNITWRVVGQQKSVAPNGICRVCLLEKTTIMLNNGPNTLNVRSEIYKRCPHRDKNALRNC